MGKTKTAVIEGEEKVVKSGKDKYLEKKAKKASQNSETTSEATQTKTASKVQTGRGKRYIEAKSKADRIKFYSTTEAIKNAKLVNYAKFDATMEAHFVLKKGGVNTNVTLPYSTGKVKKVEVASEDTIEKLKAGKVDFDVLLATAEMMPKLVMFAKLLGPKGLMPNPKNGTIIKSEKDKEKFSGNAISLKSEKEAPLVHTSFGKVSQDDKELSANLEAIIKSLGGEKQIVRAFIKTSMSPSIKLKVA